jgi:hypothetical protein
MTNARWISALGMLAIAALATSCATSSTTTATSSVPAIAPPTATVPPGATVPPATTAATPVPPATTVATATIQASTTATANPCLAFAASHAFIQLSTAVTAPDGSLTLTGHPATMSCGGPDDFHYDVATSTEVAHALPGATVQVLGTDGSTTEQTIPHAQLPSYLATDHNTRVFIFTGPLSAVTALQEQFHP